MFATIRGSIAIFSSFERKGHGFYTTHPWGKVRVRTTSMGYVPVASGASTLVRCGAVRACLVNGVDMAAPEERHSRVGLRVAVYPGFSPRWGKVAEGARLRQLS